MAVIRCKTQDEWLAERDKSIGASEAAAVLNIHPWCTPLQLHLRKRGLAPAIEESESMRWGHRLEQVIADAFTEEAGIKTRNPGDFAIYRRGGVPYMHATPDRFCQNAVLEIKTVGGHMAHHWKDADGCDDIPAYVRCQLQAAMYCTGRYWGHVAALIAGQRFVYWLGIPIDRPFCEDLDDRCREAWERIATERPPEATDDDLAAVAALYAEEPEPGAKALDWQCAMHADEFDEATEWIARYTKQRDAAKANIQLALGEYERGVLPDGSGFTWKANKNGIRTLRRTKANGATDKS